MISQPAENLLETPIADFGHLRGLVDMSGPK